MRWGEIVATDPRLPDELLPDPSPRREARRGFVDAYDRLGPFAELRVRQLVDRVDEAAGPRHHRVAGLV